MPRPRSGPAFSGAKPGQLVGRQRLARRGSGAARAATHWPARSVVFDLLHLGDTDLASWSYACRWGVLEGLFADAGLAAPFTLCLTTTDPATAREWLT